MHRASPARFPTASSSALCLGDEVSDAHVLADFGMLVLER